ncbi:MAG: sulfatase [Planctomycetota bacterium]
MRRPFGEATRHGVPRRRLRWTLATVIGAAAGLAGCGSDGSAERTSEPLPESLPDVVLISIDTLRADHCSVYGYERPTTPFLERLGREGAVFEAAYSTSSWTAPSMASLFTGLPPRAHGVTDGAASPDGIFRQQRLDRDFETLAESFSAAGYQTLGVSTNGHLIQETGFAQGFDDFVSLGWGKASKYKELADDLASTLSDGPDFLWLHFFDPHFPYSPQTPWSGEYLSQLGADAQRWGGASPAPPEFQAWVGSGAAAALYDSEIAYCDGVIDKLLRHLGLQQEAVICVVSDHGEAFYEHGEFTHGNTLYEEETRVPFLLRIPGREGGQRIEEPVSLIDVPATLLASAGIRREALGAGRDLTPLLSGETVAPATIVTELARGKKDQVALRMGGLKYYVTSGVEECYDLARDPGEQSNLIVERPAIVAELRSALEAWQGRWPPYEAEVIDTRVDSNELEQLEQLGYGDG